MANTKSNTRLICGSRRTVQYLTLAYVDAQETDYVVFSSSGSATAGGYTDPSDSTIISIKALVSAASTARVFLEFDATTDVVAMTLPIGNPVDLDFHAIGGLVNNSGSGKTGDITLTTTGLGAGDTITLILEVRPD